MASGHSPSTEPVSAHAFPDGLLHDLLAVSLTGVNLLRPLYDPTGALEDFALEYLNPAAQHITGLPEQPGGTMRSRFPETFYNGVFAFYQRVYQTGEAGRYDFNYQADGFDNYFRVAARRSGELLVVSFTDTADQPRTAVEEALRKSQAAEKTARAEAERGWAQLQALLTQAPVAIALLQGEDLHVVSANDLITELWGYTPAHVVGRPLLEGVPELQGQGFDGLMRDVMRTQVPFVGKETAAVMLRHSQLQTSYFNFVYHPQYDAGGQVQGVIIVATDMTDQVRSRQQVQQLNEELAAINEELRASNDEYLTANTALGETQLLLRQLNAELEARVAARTQELTQAQAEADAQRLRLHQLITEAPALIATLRGPAHVVELANEGFRAIFGGRDLVGKPYREAIPEFESQPFFDRLDRVYRTGETYHGIDEPVVLDRTNSGQLEHTYITYTYQATRDTQGQIDGILVFCYEVTEQVRARQERDAQRQQLREVFEQAPVAIFVLRGPEYVFEVVNPSMGEMLGSPPDQVLGQRYFDLLPALAQQGYREMLAQVWHSGQAYVAQEQAAQLPHHRAGETGYYNFTYVPLREAEGSVTGIMCVAIDVTYQVKAREQVEHLNQDLAAINEEMQATNEELNDSNQQLTRVNADLDNFIYTASHDLKAPIANIEGLLAAMQHELPATSLVGQVPTMLALMQGAIERFGRTIGHLTDVARLQQEHRQPARELPLAHLVREVELDLAPLIRQAAAQVEVAVPEAVRLTFSEKNLRSVVYNLLSNALKYRHPDRVPVVRIAHRLEAPYQVLDVADNGLGLDVGQDEEKLFGLFQRLHTHVEGTGIGLYMVKRMVENAGGRITVRSKLGQGTTFSVYFPQ